MNLHRKKTRYSLFVSPLAFGDRLWLLTLLTLLLLLPAASGCVGGVLYGIFIDPLVPKSKVKAEHDMRGKDVLVWVDDFSDAEQSPILRRTLTLKLQEELLRCKALGSVVDYELLVRLRYQDPGLSSQSVQQIGAKVKAQEVLYVLIDKFTLHHEAGRGYYNASLGGYCKVIDVATGRRRWPQGQTHRSFHAGGQVTTGRGQAFEDEQIRRLCRNVAEQIAPYFYKHRK